MKPEIKQKWLAALRSGEYKQGQGYLHRVEPNGKETFCCLGVLCDLAAKEGIGGWRDENLKVFKETDNYGSTATITEEVREWAGIAVDEVRGRDIHVVIDSGLRMSLIDLNDNRRDTFSQIANIIEQDKTL